MSGESDFISALRRLPLHAGARGLLDDAAVLETGGKTLVLTHDMIVEGVHFLSSDPPEDVAWKLLAVNLSDLAAKGARPVGVLLGYGITLESDWDAAFLRGLHAALETFASPLLGGDTVGLPPAAPRTLGLTAIGGAGVKVPSRAGASEGDTLWVSGSIGDAALGLRIATGEMAGAEALLRRYRRPEPRLGLGTALAPLVSAMMDVSDGLLIDAARLAQASGRSARMDLGLVPISPDHVAVAGDRRAARLEASIGGDDYELLFAAPPALREEILAVSAELGLPLTTIGALEPGAGIRLFHNGEPLPLPSRLGFEHIPSFPKG